MKFIKRYYAAQELIKQIREGKWTVHWNTIDDSHLTAGCGSLELWIGNDPFFCEVSLDFCAPETAENVLRICITSGSPYNDLMLFTCFDDVKYVSHKSSGWHPLAYRTP